MNEADWSACTDSLEMLEHLGGEVSRRKVRLLGCACVRFIWSLLPDELPAAVHTAELFADRKATKAALRKAREEVRAERRALELAEAQWRPRWVATWLAEVATSEKSCRSVVPEMNRLRLDTLLMEPSDWATVCALLRDVFGNPFRPVAFDPAWLASNDGTAVKLAQGIYDDRAFDRLPILADCLEDAGCTCGEVLDHLRSPGPHVPGCWALDGLLGKE